MRSIFTLFSCRLVLVVLFFSSSLSKLNAQTHTPKTVAINAACGGYYEYLPVNYNTTTGKYPVLIYIAGGNNAFGNGTASSMAIILNQGVPRVINQNLMPKTFTVNGETTSYIIISPQFRYKPSPTEVNSFIDYIVNAYPRIDRARICLTGFSIGGDVAWKTPYDLASASRLAALVPVAGYNNPYSDGNAQYIAAGKLPVWAIHSNGDAAPVSWTISMVNKINSYNPAVPPVLSRPDGLTHEQTHVVVYEPTYKPNGLNIYEWCLQFRRTAATNPPVANAGTDKTITLPTSNVTLTGSGSDPDGGTLSYRWTKISGPTAYTISSPAAASTAITGLTAGDYQFQLEVTDPGGLSDKDTAKVTVLPAPNQLPVAKAGADVSITLPQNSITLSSAGSTDADGTIASYNWSKISGPASFTINNAAAANPVVSNLASGTYAIQLTVTDNSSAIARDTVIITVNAAANQLPVAKAGADISITLPQNSVTLSSAGSTDADGTIASYNWNKISGPASFTINNAAAANPVVSNLTSGTYAIQLTVTDNSSAIARDTVIITVNAAANQLPVAKAGADVSITLPQNSVTLSSAGSTDADGTIASYNWNKISGPASFTINNAAAANPVVSNLASGTYAIQLTVTDNNSAIARDTVIITVNTAPNQLPVARAGADQTITLPANTASLSGASSSDADGSIAGYQWSQVAGPSASTLSNAASVTATASNLVAGTYSFELLVRDNNNATAKDTVRVIVNPASGSTRLLKVNVFSGSNPAGTGWNNWNIQSNLTLSNAKFADGSSSSITANLSSSNAVADNGSNYPVTMCPVEVGRSTSYSTILRTVTLSGLDNTKKYELEVYSSRGGSGNTTKFTVGSTVINILSSNNYANKAVFTNLTPASGQIKLTLERLNTYNYINGFILTEIGTGPVTPPNQNPVAAAGADQQVQLPANSVQLNGSGSTDSDGTIASYQWTKVSGPAQFNLSNATIANPVLSNLAAGVYVFELTVTDDKGATHKDSVTITVNAAANQLPVANAGADITITLPQNSVTLTSAGSTDPDGSIASYNWSKISGPESVTVNNAGAANPVVSNLTSGTYVVQLTVTDNNGAIARDTMIIVVNAAANQLPVANAGTNQSINLPSNTVNLNGAASSDPDGSIASYQWRQLSGPSTAVLNNATTSVASAGNLIEGLYTFELLVKDNNNAEAKDTANVTVNAPLLSEKILKVNVYGGANPAGSEWNNWNVQSNLTLSSTKYADGTPSPVKATLNVSNAVADNGNNYPVTMCPVEVGRSTSYSTVARFVTLSGLDNTKRYELEVYSSRGGAGNTTKFTVGSTVINILSSNNYNNKAVFTNITPSSGQIRLTIERLNTYNYINGFTLKEIGSEESLVAARSVSSEATASSVTEVPVSKGELGTYPNPFRDNLDLQVNNDKTGTVKVTLINQSGKPVKFLQFVKEQGVLRRSISLQDLQPGVYFLQVQMNGWTKSEKVVKM